MKVKIITDSACDITQEEAKELGIEILPLKTLFSDGEYLDGIDLSHREFYEKLIELREFPRTSQVNAYAYQEAFKKYPDYDILVLTISKKISGCYQSAMIAKEEFKNVTVVDTANLSIGQQLLVRYALNLVKEDKGVDEIAKEIEEKKKRLCVMALLDTLEYLKKGGRLSTTQALVGTFLGIKPVAGVVDGKITLLGKARGSKNGQNLLRKVIVEAGGIDYSLPYVAAYSGLSDSLVKKYLLDSKDLYTIKMEDIPIVTIGSTIGSHIGPNAIGVAFFKKN